MNQYIQHLNRIEFEITLACTGRCKHCSEGDHVGCSGHIDGTKGAEAVRRLAVSYPISSLMTFGGEPLLYPEVVCQIQQAAREMGIPKRHVITNGYFSKDEQKITEVAAELAACGVTKVYLSVDAFHQETIPLCYVKSFARALLEKEVYVVTHPAWLVSQEDDNPYNVTTRTLLAEFAQMGIDSSDGNVIFPSGNAAKYLRDYFDASETYIDPYEEDPTDVHTVSIGADGSVFGGNLMEQDIMDILAAYRP